MLKFAADRPLEVIRSTISPAAVMFDPSPELGQLLTQLREDQVAIDHRRTEELARLRAIQDRD